MQPDSTTTPEEAASDIEYACIVKYGGLRAEDTCHLRLEQLGKPHNLDVDDNASNIVCGGPFEISTSDEITPVQNKIEANLYRQLRQVLHRDIRRKYFLHRLLRR